MIELTVNGVKHQLDIESDTPILWAIRDHIGLKGSKFGCGAGLCGACTMHLNGQPIRTCITPVAAANGQSITTVENTSDEAGIEPVRAAWRELNVPQCGYCQSGQMMSAAALLKQTPAPSDEQIDQAMAGNICRCGTYPRIKKAIRMASDMITEVKLDSSSKAKGA